MTVAVPPVIVEAFALNGTKNVIPVPSQILVTPGAASFNDGFPPLTMTPISSGGVPFFGADMNGVLNMISAHTAWVQGGGQYSYDAGFSTANTGYGLGAVLQSTADPRIFWSNRLAGNTNNPDVSAVNWQPIIGYPRTAREITAGVTPSDVRFSGAELVQGNVKRWGCVCDGVTDDTAAFQRALDSIPSTGGHLFIPSDMVITGAVTVSQPGTQLEIQNGSTLKVMDGNYIAINVNAQGFAMAHGQVWGSNNTTPLVTLIKVGKTGTPAPLASIMGVNFAFASKCVVYANTYQSRATGNYYSNADVYFTTTAEGSTTDITLSGESFGTSTIGSSYLVDLKSNGTRVLNCYWETSQTIKGSLIWRTGCQYGVMTGGLVSNSGGFRIEPSNNILITGLSMQGTYDSVNQWVWRVDGSSTASFIDCQIAFASVVASISGIVASGNINASGCYLLKCAFGIFGGVTGSITGNTFDTCTVGYEGGNGSTEIVTGNVFNNCTTAVVGTGSAAFMLGRNQYVGNGTNISAVSTVLIEERNSGVAASVADGGTITHNHVKTPTSIQVSGSGTDIVTVDPTSINATTFAVKIKTGAAAPGSAQTIYWSCAG